MCGNMKGAYFSLSGSCIWIRTIRSRKNKVCGADFHKIDVNEPKRGGLCVT